MNIKRLFNSPATITLLILTALNLIIYSYIFPSFLFADDFYCLYITMSSSAAELFSKMIYLSMHDYFRPILYMLIGINYSLFHLHYQLLYIVSFVFQLVNCILIYFFVLKLAKNERTAALSSVLFAVYPGNWEAIGWMCQVTHRGLITFGLVFLLAFYRFLEKKQAGYYILAFVMLLLSASLYDAAIVYIVFAALLEFFIFEERSIVRIAEHISSFFLIFIVLGLIDLFKRSMYGISDFSATYKFGWHIIPNMFDYCATLVFPVTTQYKLSTLIPHDILLSVISVKYILFIALPFLVIYLLLKENGSVKFFTLWSLIALFPFTLFLTAHTSRYLYNASIGYVALIGIGIDSLHSKITARRHKIALHAGIIILILAFLATSVIYQKVFYYKKEIRKDILSDLMRISPRLDENGHYYFMDLPVREDEIKYMLYLWFNKKNVDIRVIDKKGLSAAERSVNTHIFDYEQGHLVKIR